jgi:Zn-dependent M16 (insulinase) family peptidase
MTLEAKARVEETLVSSGHQLVSLRLRSRFSEAGWAAERMHGVSYLIFLRSLLDKIDNDWPSVLSTLEEMRQILVNRNTMMFNATVDKDNWTAVKDRLDSFCDRIPAAPPNSPAWTPDPTSGNEGLAVPTQVNYVGKGVRLFDTGYRFHGSALVIMRYLRNSWLWQQVRVQGGAYGAFCSLDRLSGSLVFVSYRDPNIRKTLDAFDKTADYLRTAQISENELTKAIIGAIGDIDEYMLPDAKGYASLARTLAGDADESRQAIREEVLGTTIEHFRAFGDAIEALGRQGLVAIIASQRALEEATEDSPEWLKVSTIL